MELQKEGHAGEGVAAESKGTAGNCSQLERLGELHANSNENMKKFVYFCFS